MAEPTYRQVTHWVSKGWLQPATRGTGHPYEWPADELRIRALMGRLVDAGVTPASAARLARTAVTVSGEPLLVAVPFAPGLTLLVDDTRGRVPAGTGAQR